MSFLKYTKYIFVFFWRCITLIKDFLFWLLDFLKSIILFIKGSIDCIYKILFISFFCLLAYIGYKVFTSATNINEKLNELQTAMVNIQQTSDELSKITQKISENITKYTGKNSEKNKQKINNLTEKIKNFI